MAESTAKDEIISIDDVYTIRRFDDLFCDIFNFKLRSFINIEQERLGTFLLYCLLFVVYSGESLYCVTQIL